MRMTTLEAILLLCALAASLALQPWRMLRGGGAMPPLATPLLASLVLLPWLWAWPVGADLPMPLQWSGAALAVLMLGWPLAIPVLALAGASTMLTAGAPIEEAISTTVWSGVLPATAVLLMGHAVRRAFGTHPLAYIVGRAYAVPLAAVFFSVVTSAWAGGGISGDDEAAFVVAFLMAMGEAAWTCALASLLVAWQPAWLATWSDERYLTSRKSPPRRA
jgi:uncharacterized membrane protein